jgi:Putative prokaryotic signal transducing protein
MQERTEPWVVVATFSAIWEADFAAETLREAGIPAHVEGGQNVGVFGIGYQGHTQFGVRLRVPWHREDDARTVLGMDDEDDPRAEADAP